LIPHYRVDVAAWTPLNGNRWTDISGGPTQQGSGGERERLGDTFVDLVAGLAHAAARLHPTKAFFDPFADTLADGIIWISRRAAINS
jgi:hypothetical protein